MLKKANHWMTLIYGALMVAAGVLAIMDTGHADYSNVLIFFGGMLLLVSLRRQWMYNSWIVLGGLLLIHAGALCNGLAGELNISHHLVRLVISCVILGSHLKIMQK